jgi:hypothetical protein
MNGDSVEDLSELSADEDTTTVSDFSTHPLRPNNEAFQLITP